ncbi:MAG: hypothetical protein JO250_03860 [Armatimonadetes bacterium]|nr:hypothetical protein [Armatimonadota bacterium]
MRYYHYWPDVEHFGYLRFVEKFTHEEGFPISGQFHQGVSLLNTWQPVSLKADTRHGKLGDFPKAQVGPPVVSQRAWSVLRPLLGEDVEALPVVVPQGEYLALNILSIIDCLDYECSEVTWFPHGSLHDITKYCLKPGLAERHSMFKIPEEMTYAIVTEEFRQAINEAGLEGLSFHNMIYDPGE